MAEQDVSPGEHTRWALRRRGGALLRGLVVVVAVCAVAVAGGAARQPASPGLHTAGATDPLPPGDVTVTPDDRALAISWTAPPETLISGYRVYVDGTLAGSPTTTSTTVSGLVNGREYSVTVSTRTSLNTYEGRPSSPVLAKPADSLRPAAPTGVTATAGDGTVTVSWVPNGTDHDVDGYRVLREDTAPTALLPGQATASHPDTTVVNDNTYRYTVQTHDTSGNWSVSSAPVVSATPTDMTAPVAPTGLRATAGDGEVDLVWTANAEPDVAEYRVLRDGVEVVRVPGTTYTDPGLVNGTPYTYTLQAVDRHGNWSPVSGPGSATPVPDPPPAAPTGVTATPGDGRAVIGWTAVPEADVVEYRVLAENGGVAATAAASATSATVPWLVNGATYRFTVVAVDAAGQSSVASAAVTVTPAAGVVPAGGAGESGGLATSSDGRYVVVGTRARLEAGDTNTAYELYLLDRTAGSARRIAPLPASATGATDPTNTSAPAISDDGRHVALATTAALLPADTNRLSDVYRLDTRTGTWPGTWSLVSVPAVGGKVHGSIAGTVLHTGPSVYAKSPTVVLSADGDLVLFHSERPDLVTGDTNGVVDVFAKRMTDGVVTRVSTTATGGNLPRTAVGPALALTPDGRFALFAATSWTGPVVLYRKTLSGAGAGEAVVVSSVVVSGRVTEFGVFRDAGDVALSDDGRYVALVTAAKLGTTTPTASWGTGLAHRVDTTTRTALAMGNGQTTVWEHQVELDPTGRYGFFATTAAQVAGDGNGHTDHLRRDLDGGVPGPLVLATADAGGQATTGPTGSITSSEYGRLVALTGDRVLVTTSQALVASDGNGLRDLYAKDLSDGVVGSPVG